MDQVETHIYTLNFTTGASVYKTVTAGLPFTVHRIVFKPLNCYFTAENGFYPLLVYSDLIDRTKAIGYSGHIAQQLPPVAGQAGQWVAVNNDVTFTLQNPLDMQNKTINFWCGSVLNGGSVFDTAPFTGIIVVTVEYHSR